MLSKKEIPHPNRITFGDFISLIIVGSAILAVATTAQRWSNHLQSEVPIDLSTSSLILYSTLSLMRGLIAYIISLGLALWSGWLAARSKFWERIILPILDIGQSLPVLGFLPGLVLGLMALFPNSNVGLEMACVLMIVSGQLWNMAFSFYSSLKNIPPEFNEVAKISKLDKLSRFTKIELPFSATPLAWNSLVSIAGGWFFLTICESFTLKGQSFRLPGLGSYMAEALDKGKTEAILMGLFMMMAVIILLDFIVWRPIISWSLKFRPDDQPIADLEIPFMSLLYKQSKLADFLLNQVKKLRGLLRRQLRNYEEQTEIISSKFKKSYLQNATPARRTQIDFYTRRFGRALSVALIIILGFWVCGKLYQLVQPVSWSEWLFIGRGCLFTLARIVGALVIATAWTLPVGILIGLSPKLTRIFQPLIQIMASFPAPMIFPLVFLGLKKLGFDLGVSATFLLVVGIQWYILFNVLAGSVQIAGQHIDSFKLMNIGWKDAWKNLYLPSVFPFLVTGWITAAGGAWNASIVTEYLEYGGKTFTTEGIGSVITLATVSGNFSLLSAALLAMVGVVVFLNRSVWKFLFHYAETRFSFAE